MDIDPSLVRQSGSLEAQTRPSLDHSILPSEVWLIIVSLFCQSFGHFDLANLTLTCWRLRALALPSMFRSLHISLNHWHDSSLHLAGHGDPRNGPLLTRERYEWTIDKLHFFASESIASAVSFCCLAPTPRRNQDRYNRSDTSSDQFMLHIIDTFFEILPRMSNLQHFTFESVSFTTYQLNQLSAFPELRNVHIISCDFSAIDPVVLRLSVHNLWLLNVPNHIGDEARMLELFVDPDSLRVLHIEQRFLNVLHEFTAVHPLSRLRHLEIHRPLALSSQTPIFLPPTQKTFPALKLYRDNGPEHTMTFFMQGGRVRHLALTQTRNAAPSHMAIDRLISMESHAADLVTMVLNVEDLTTTLLSEICSRCVRLRALSLRVAEPRITARINSLYALDDLAAALLTALRLSDALEFLEITTHYGWNSGSPTARRAIRTMRDNLGQHPTLRYVSLSAWGSVLEEKGGRLVGERYAEVFSARFDPCSGAPVGELKIEDWRNRVLGKLDEM